MRSSFSSSTKRLTLASITLMTLVGITTLETPALAAGVAPQLATPVQREQAQGHFLRAKEKFNKKEYEEALSGFQASLDIVASPNTRLFIGRCLRELNRTVAAYVELGRTEVEAKELSGDDSRYEKAGQSAHEERAQLEPKLGFVNVDVANAEPGTTLKVAGDEVHRGGGSSEAVPVAPGEVEMVVETPGRAPIKRTMTLAAGERKSIAIDAAEGGGAVAAGSTSDKDARPAPSTGPGPLRNVAYVTGGAAVVGLGIFAFFGLKANGTYSDLEKACNNGPCPPGHEAQISEGRTQQTTANIGLAVFIIGAAATATLWVLSAPKSPATTAPNAARSSHFPARAACSPPPARASINVGPSFVGLRGAF